MNNYKLTKWGAERLLSYYLGIDDWGCQEWDEEKYNPIIRTVLEKTVKTGKLEMPEQYHELKQLFACDMSSGLTMDEMNVEEIESCATHPYANSSWDKEIGCSKITMLKTIEQYQFLIREFEKDGMHPIQFKQEETNE